MALAQNEKTATRESDSHEIHGESTCRVACVWSVSAVFVVLVVGVSLHDVVERSLGSGGS